MIKFKNFLTSTWELPQNLLGRLVVKMFNAIYYDKALDSDTVKLYVWNVNAGLSLGNYIFIPDQPVPESFIKHEYGHSLQSKQLGWLYLPVIGIPSIIWFHCFSEYRKKHNVSYYSFYTEKWADRLGGVNREDNQ